MTRRLTEAELILVKARAELGEDAPAAVVLDLIEEIRFLKKEARYQCLRANCFEHDWRSLVNELGAEGQAGAFKAIQQLRGERDVAKRRVASSRSALSTVLGELREAREEIERLQNKLTEAEADAGASRFERDDLLKSWRIVYDRMMRFDPSMWIRLYDVRGVLWSDNELVKALDLLRAVAGVRDHGRASD